MPDQRVSTYWKCDYTSPFTNLWYIFFYQLLKGVTIASGGVLPNIHPELLKKRKGGKLVSPEELKPKKPKTTPAPKAATSGKKIASPAKKAASPAKKAPSPAKKAPISAGKGKRKGVSVLSKNICHSRDQYSTFRSSIIKPKPKSNHNGQSEQTS